MRSSGITVYTETSSSFIPPILHEEIHEILPVLILHTEGKEIFYPVYKDLQGISDIPVIHDIRPSRHYYTFQHLPVQSSTFQCYPVYPGIPPIPAFLQLECNSTHRLVSTRNSIECQSNTGH